MAGILIHEWIEASGGAEHVLAAMAESFPDADIQCLWDDAPQRFADRNVSETWLARTPLRRKKALALPLMVPTWRRLHKPGGYDWMLISSHLFAHHAQLRGQDVPKFVYAHTPARYIWNPELDERGNSVAIRSVAPMFRRVDRRRAQEATSIAANSAFVRDRIATAWERDAVVIHPPVAVDRILSVDDWRTLVTDDAEKRLLSQLPETFVLGASRFIPYKRLDLVIHAAERAGLPVIIAGRGPEEEHLRAIAAQAKVPALVVLSPSDELLYALMQSASAFVFPPVEDFGIVPVEAQAAGTPVVTGPVGGQVETYEAGVSGVTASSTAVSDIASAIEAAANLPRFDAASVTSRFSEARFADNIRRFVS